VKRILLIEERRPFWPRIRDLLAKVNAVVEEVPPREALAAVTAARPISLLSVTPAVPTDRWRGGTGRFWSSKQVGLPTSSRRLAVDRSR